MINTREFWLSPFSRNTIPNWSCPKCNEGILVPIKNCFIVHEEGTSILESTNYPDFPHENKRFRYSLTLRCNNNACKELVISCGSGYGVIEYNTELKKGFYDEKFIPEYFSPTVLLFIIPKSCPNRITEQIISSFKLFFVDPSASANYVRKAVEEILTNERVKRYTISKRKRIRISLNYRIVAFQKNKPDVARKLLAVKWIGNEGSHIGNISKNDVLDAYEILESILDDLYVGYKKLVDRKIEKIIKSKKPLHPSS